MRRNAPSRSIRFASTLLTLAVLLSCSGNKAVPDSDSARTFVQDFYDWYVPISLKDHTERASDIALKERSSAFDSDLARELKEDSDAQSRVPGDIVGLDSDPFLASQDPCERYQVIAVRESGQSYLVSVRGSGGCEKHEDADVVVEVVARDGTWLFSNFQYPRSGGDDLRTVLKQLRDERSQSPR